MTTFVLVLVLSGGGAVTIPGYPSEDACKAAGQAASSQGMKGVESGAVDPMVSRYICVPGPQASPRR